VTGEGWTTFHPLDLWCPTCHAAPGIRCAWTDAAGDTFSREPHAARVLSAGEATSAARRRAMRPPRSSSSRR
jgi:hypothetical protein